MCIFCKICDGEIESKKYYEDENSFMIADINPKAKKHYLFIPKNHYKLLADQTNNNAIILGQMLNKIPQMAKELGIENGYRIIINQGDDGRQEVPHLHVHILGGEKLSD